MILTNEPFRIVLCSSTQVKLDAFLKLSCRETDLESGEKMEFLPVTTNQITDLLKQAELLTERMPCAVLFYDTEVKVIIEFLEFIATRHHTYPVFVFNENLLEKDILDSKAIILKPQQIKNGYFVNEILNIAKWSRSLTKDLKKQHFDSIAKGARFYSHEIKNPLTNIDISSAELKSERDIQNIPPSAFLHFIEKNSHRINELLGMVLQCTRTDDLLFELVAIDQIAESVFNSCSSRFPQIQFQMGETSGCKLFADEEKLGAALYNLVVNAAEACILEEGKITLNIQTEGKYVKVFISDNGSGISQDDAAYICEPFFTTKIKSAGLGLSATEDIIHRHSGKLNFQNNSSGGALFTVTLPT